MPEMAGNGRKGGFVIQFDPAVEEEGEQVMDSLI